MVRTTPRIIPKRTRMMKLPSRPETQPIRCGSRAFDGLAANCDRKPTVFRHPIINLITSSSVTQPIEITLVPDQKTLPAKEVCCYIETMSKHSTKAARRSTKTARRAAKKPGKDVRASAQKAAKSAPPPPRGG